MSNNGRNTNNNDNITNNYSATSNPYYLLEPSHDDIFFPFSTFPSSSQTLHGCDTNDDGGGGGGGFNDFLMHGSIDYTSLSRGLGFSTTSSEVLSSALDGAGSQHQLIAKDKVEVVAHDGGGGENPETPNSSISSSSTEAGGGDGDDEKGSRMDSKVSDHQGGEDSKKENKGNKKKGDKKQKEPRFAFMTKSEIDHLEDGYRWRKYGQKAVKNSPYPRSYYRCTTQKCTVKKRVERSFQDPTTVITTYEGQHNHPVPATLRGHAAALLHYPHYSMLTPPPPSSPPTFPQELLTQLVQGHGRGRSGNMIGAPISFQSNIQTLHHYNQQFSSDDYGLLQDMVPSFFKQEP